VAGPDWTGFYLGGNVGAVLLHAYGNTDFLDPSAPAPFQSNPQANSFSKTHFIAGVQAGYNWQLNSRWIAGIEADWDGLTGGYGFCRQTDSLSAACTDNGLGFENIDSSTKWLATLRGRLGMAVNNFLLYATGGAAWGRVDTTLVQSCLAANCGNSPFPRYSQFTSSVDKIGWVAGLGAEYALNASWSARAEWLYVDLGTINSALLVNAQTNVGGPPIFSPQTTTWSRREQYNQFRIGINYRFH
jgi:outer membrane immunogenic protein